MNLRISAIYLIIILFVSSCSHSRITDRSKYSGSDRDIAYARPFPQKPKIVIDPGHGGKDVGAESLKGPKYQEKSLNLTTAMMLNNFLQGMGYQTIMTRGEDFFVPLELRTAFANSNQAVLFVSVHYNSAPNTKAQGVEVYYYQAENNKGRTEQSKKLAKMVLDQVIANTHCKSRGCKAGDLAVVRETKMPAILVEGGFVTNEEELQKIRNPKYQRALAEGIANGIRNFLNGKG